MNKSNLKSYAPQARKDFIAAVTARAQQLGITMAQVQPVTVSGDVAIIDGLIVNGSAKVVGLIGSLTRLFQTGYLYHYALVMILGVLAFMTWFVFLQH